MRLSAAQRSALREMAREAMDERGYGRWGWGSSHTNRKAAALERMGYARYEYDRSRGMAGYPWGRWYITDAGRAALL